MVAALMSLNALAIDVMLPALGQIAEDLSVSNPNDRQLVVFVYIMGFGFPQLVFGPLTDRFGRRRTLFIGLIGYIATGAFCVWSYRFDLLLIARFAQGVFAGATRVVAVAVVRDTAAGPSMARLMSLVMTVFMIVPILAPGLGQVILQLGPWQWCFGALAVYGSIMLTWTAIRLPESTVRSERVKQSVLARIVSYREVARHRTSIGYMLAGGCVFGALFGFILASEQIFRDVFDQDQAFALWFAGVAVAMSIANLVNARLVVRFGPRLLSHGALIAFVSIVSVALMTTLLWGDQLWVFYGFLLLAFACFGFVGANFNAIALEPLGRIAGTGSAAIGFVTTTGSGVLGGWVGRAFDGSTRPLWVGYLILSGVALIIVSVTERGRLFRSGRAK